MLTEPRRPVHWVAQLPPVRLLILAFPLACAATASSGETVATEHSETPERSEAPERSETPERSEWLKRPFSMLGIDHGPHAFQLTPEGWLRSGGVTLIIDFDGQSLTPWTWVEEREPGLARTTSTGDDDTVPDGAAGSAWRADVQVAAVALPLLRHDLTTAPARPEHYNIASPVSNPVLLLRIDVARNRRARSPDVAPAKLVLRVWSDSGQNAGSLLGAEIAEREESVRPARWQPGNPGAVTIADSLVLVASTPPDTVFHSTLPDGTPQNEFFQLVYHIETPETLEFRLPYFAVPVAQRARLSAGPTDELLAGVRSAWRTRLTAGARVTTPETTVEATALASLYHLLAGSFIGRDHDIAIVGGPFLYRQIFVRDAAFVVVALDRFGFHDDARAGIEFLLAQQRPSGEIFTQTGQRDGNGQALWALGEHLLRTRDREFARDRFDLVRKLVGRLRHLLRDHDRHPFPGLLPRATLRDNEQVDRSHIVGYNLWTYAGLRGAIEVARTAGVTDSVTTWSRLAAGFAATLDGHLDDLLARTGGRITPAFEGLEARSFTPGLYGDRGGLDWGNLQIVFPSRVWRAGEPRLRTNLDIWCANLHEGLYPYPYGGNRRLIHHYLTTSLAHTLLESGRDTDRRHLFAIFYDGLLGHTTGTFGGSEIIDARARDVWPPENGQPHNTFSARYLLLLSDMLAYADGDTLHLGAGFSPAWMRPGGTTRLDGVGTPFGWVDVAFEVGSGGGIGDDPDGHPGKNREQSWTIRFARRINPPDRPASRPAQLSAPHAVVEVTVPPRSLRALIIPAPLGFRITGVEGLLGDGAGIIATTDRRIVLAPGTEEVTLRLEGAADGAYSLEAARERLRRR